MKKLMAVLLALLLFNLQVIGRDFLSHRNSSSELYYLCTIKSDNTVSIKPYEIIYYSLVLKTIVIPNSVKDNYTPFIVTEISKGAFRDYIYLTSVTIPNTITTIGGGAFNGCLSLKSIDIPNSVTTIGDYAFVNCIGLSSLTLGKSVVSIGNNAFRGCTKLSFVNFPDKLKTIGDYAFYECTSLGGSSGSISIDPSIESIGYRAFGGCTNLKEIYVYSSNKNYSSHDGVLYNYDKTTLIQYPAAKYNYYFTPEYSVTEICDYAFEGAKVMDVTIPYDVKTIGEGAFKDCSNLSYIWWSCDVAELKPYTFKGCSSLTARVPYSVKTIGKEAYADCTSMTSIDFSNNVTSIGEGAFKGCTGASRITIPKNITKIEADAFKDCSNATIYCEAGSKPSGWSDNWNPDNLTVYWGCKIIGVETTANGKAKLTGTNYATTDSDGRLWYLAGTTNGTATITATPKDDYHTRWEDLVITDSRTFVVSATKTYYISFDAHTEVVDKSVPATCTKHGKSRGLHCAVCEKIINEQKIVPATGHTEIVDGAVAPTCTEKGKTAGKHCSVCGEVLEEQKDINANGHTEVIDKAVAPTCTQTGLTQGKHCSVCNVTLSAQQTIKANGHTEIVDPEEAPTCTAKGKTAGKHCSVCSEVLVEQKDIAMLLHSFTDYVYNEDATTEVDGTETALCDYGCGATDTRTAEGTKLVIAEPTAVCPTEKTSLKIYAQNNNIVVENATDEIIVYDIAGRTIAWQSPIVQNVIAIGNNGIFIVKVGGMTQKLIIE